jgi:hypothetical protein
LSLTRPEFETTGTMRRTVVVIEPLKKVKKGKLWWREREEIPYGKNGEVERNESHNAPVVVRESAPTITPSPLPYTTAIIDV